ncbi:MAG: DUF6766 family protein [Vicinamibacteraceae bacterium]
MSRSDAFGWLRDRSMTLTMLALFAVCAVGQIAAGWVEYNHTLTAHGGLAVALGGYVTSGHFWEAIFENWESEFLQMSAFVVLSAYLYQIGSPESRRPGVHELVDADPRQFRDQPDVPWPVRRGGWALWAYQYSLGGALFLLFLLSFAGHLVGGWAEQNADQRLHGEAAITLLGYATSSRFWFESLQNWQSEFLSVGAMVWLAVYLRQRGSPESKPVHAPHAETGR